MRGGDCNWYIYVASSDPGPRGCFLQWQGLHFKRLTWGRCGWSSAQSNFKNDIVSYGRCTSKHLLALSRHTSVSTPWGFNGGSCKRWDELLGMGPRKPCIYLMFHYRFYPFSLLSLKNLFSATTKMMDRWLTDAAECIEKYRRWTMVLMATWRTSLEFTSGFQVSASTLW